MAVARHGTTILDTMHGDRFADAYPLASATLRHRLADHPLFTLPALADAAGKLPASDVERRVADAANGCDFAMASAGEASVGDSVRAIATGRQWVMLRGIERLPHYREVLHPLMADLDGAIVPRTGARRSLRAFIFVSAPGTLTPFHFDAEYNILFQIAGDKAFATYPPSPPFLSLANREAHHRAGENMLPWRPEFEAAAMIHHLAPGDALYVPYSAPHWVRAGASASISLSVTWQSDWSLAAAEALAVNPLLRRIGLGTSRPPAWPERPRLRALAARAARRVGLL